MTKRAYILFTRIPTPYKTKTRLTKRLSPTEASEVQAFMLADLFTKFQPLIKQGITVFIAYSDEQAPTHFLKQLPAEFQAFPQVGKTLGERMNQAIHTVVQKGYQEVILTGSDIPQLTAQMIETAFDQLEEVVIGPSVDGGYYLIGATAKIDLSPIFSSSVSWGKEDVLKQTLALLGQKKKVAVLPALLDIDEPTDLLRISQEHQLASPSFKRWLAENRGKYDEKSDF